MAFTSMMKLPMPLLQTSVLVWRDTPKSILQRLTWVTIFAGSNRKLMVLSKLFHIDFPDALVLEVEKCKDDKAVKQVGIEWAIQQSKELKDAGTPVLHYYTMGLSEATKAIASKVF